MTLFKKLFELINDDILIKIIQKTKIISNLDFLLRLLIGKLGTHSRQNPC